MSPTAHGVHVELALNVSHSSRLRLTIRNDRVCNNTNILSVTILLRPVGIFEARQPITPVLILHQFEASPPKASVLPQLRPALALGNCGGKYPCQKGMTLPNI
jgi:hypothetical protein